MFYEKDKKQQLNKKLSLSLTTTIIIGIVVFGCSVPTRIQSQPTNVKKTPEILGQTQGQKLSIEAQTTINQQVIELEVARTPQQQSMGLMYRESLEDNRGMLFLFDPPRPVRFWMKNVSLSLDMIFLRDGEVKEIVANVPPCQDDPCPTYGPNPSVEIDMVIELRGGQSEKLGIKPGDHIPIEFLNSLLIP